MSGQNLDLRTSARIVRRHRFVVGAIAALGLLAGIGYNLYYPPMLTATTLVVVPYAVGFATGNPAYTATQVVIAHSNPVLAGALPDAGTTMSLATLRERVQVTGLTSNVISISAQGRTAGQATATANAVADSYLSYLDSAGSPVGRVRARILGRATAATGTPPYIRPLKTAGAGLVAGVLVGAILAFAVGRRDRRLRERDQIAGSIGVPVLAAVAAEHPRGATGWVKLLEHYRPGAVDAWQLRRVLDEIAVTGSLSSAGRGGADGPAGAYRHSLAVLSLSCDRRALALGPQLAAFAASQGVPAALVVSPQQHADVAAALQVACATAPPMRSGKLVVAGTGHGSVSQPDPVALTVVVGVVDGEKPRVADTLQATTTVLAVSAGAVTADQLARVATSAAIAGRDIGWILVADPDAADRTTGRMPQLGRPASHRIPKSVIPVPTEAIR